MLKYSIHYHLGRGFFFRNRILSLAVVTHALHVPLSNGLKYLPPISDFAETLSVHSTPIHNMETMKLTIYFHISVNPGS